VAWRPWSSGCFELPANLVILGLESLNLSVVLYEARQKSGNGHQAGAE
jgi:hypothetical protein